MRHFGYIPDPQYTDTFVRSLPFPRLDRDVPKVMAMREKRDVHLWQPLKHVCPNYRRGEQGIGDCVSWGAEFACTLLLAQLAMDGVCDWEAPAATEPIYGGCRVEVHGKVPGPLDNEDGAGGSWAADWVSKWGVLRRLDYSQQTGNAMHDLRTYSAQKAKHMGYYGCGGKEDGGKLDEAAKRYPVQAVSLIQTVEAAEAALQAGCPITIASGVGFDGERNAEGIIDPRGEWPHQMVIVAIRYTPNGEPLFLVVNSWGDYLTGTLYGVEWDALNGCAFWITGRALQYILREQDSYAFSKLHWPDAKPFNFADYIRG